MKNITKFINESIKAKLLPPSNKSYFSKEAINFINNVVGTKWYIIINEEPDYNKIETLIKNINKTDKFSDDDFNYNLSYFFNFIIRFFNHRSNTFYKITRTSNNNRPIFFSFFCFFFKC